MATAHAKAGEISKQEGAAEKPLGTDRKFTSSLLCDFVGIEGVGV